MFLKSLEINGFKSFPDRTRLNFSRGITAVVGPNGSGKSNISDAILWVLGEQSTKALRSSKMDEVIFSGTQLRHEKNMASVTLVLDNTDRALPMDEDEISVTRRFYRDGESEYRINNVSVRLRDVHELFMDTGLGRDGYAMVGQGKIAAIINQRSDERREIFEEAAGIAKFRYRRTQAQRQLESANENLLRLLDILEELEQRVGPLKEQSEKAAKFIELSKQKRELEVSLWTDKIKRAENDVEQLKRQRREYSYEYEKLNNELEKCENTTQEVFAKMQKCTVDSENLRAQINTIHEQLASMREKSAVIKNDMAYSKRDIQRLNVEKDDSQKQLLILKENEKACSEKLQKLLAEKENTQTIINEIVKRQQESFEITGHLNDDIQKLEEQTSIFTNKISSVKLLSAGISAKIQQLEEQIMISNENSQTRAVRKQTLLSDLSDCDALKAKTEEAAVSVKNMAAGLKKKLDSRQDEANALKDECSKLENNKNAVLQRKRILEDMERNLEGYNFGVKFVLEQARAGVLGGICNAVSAVVRTKKEHLTAIETALGAAAQNIITMTDTDAKNAIELLKRKNKGRVTFLPLNTIRPTYLKDADQVIKYDGIIGTADMLIECEERFRPAIRFLLSRTVIADNMDTALSVSKKFSFSFKIVTLDGQVINAGGSMTGGSSSAKSGVISRRSEISDLNEQVTALSPKIDGINKKLEEKNREIAALRADIDEKINELSSINEDSLRADMEKKHILSQLDELEKDEKNLAEHLLSLNSDIEKNKNLFEEYAQQIKKNEEKLLSYTERLDSLKNDTQTQRENISALSDKKNEIELSFVSIKKDCEAAQSALETAAANIADFMKSDSERLKMIEELNFKCTQLQNELEELENQSQSALDRERQNEEKIAEYSSMRIQLEGVLTKQQKRRNELSDLREKCTSRTVVLDERIKGVSNEIEQTAAKLWEQYELSLSAAANEAKEVADEGEMQKQLLGIKGSIKALGSVNLSALQEYEEVNERYTFMKHQTDDAQMAKERLNDMITDLTEQMRSIFLEKFTKINENFSETFKELFGGGKASLELENDDVLNCGIDINVQPPGKLIKNLAALSGGEQSMVAIAIYFAILKVNPSPFCVLDEIEAALDDVNVDRFANYLHNLNDKTQFISITHRRGTMEAADSLYGVTMQEEGVSVLLELSLSEAKNNTQVVGVR